MKVFNYTILGAIAILVGTAIYGALYIYFVQGNPLGIPIAGAIFISALLDSMFFIAIVIGSIHDKLDKSNRVEIVESLTTHGAAKPACAFEDDH